MAQPARMILVAVLFAIALIASSFAFRGRTAGDWVDAALYVAMATWFTYELTRWTRPQTCRWVAGPRP